MPLLNPGDPFPRLTISTTDGQALTFPDAFAGDKETAAEMAAKNKLPFPVGYGADARAVAELTGAFVNPDPVYLRSTGFVLDPAGNLIVSVYSSGAIGRLVPDDVVGLVRYARDHVS